MADEHRNKILTKMLERIYTSLTTGPVLNCRPHASRQRIDVAQLARVDGTPGEELIGRLLGPTREVKLVASAAPPVHASTSDETPEDKAARRAWEDQQSVFSKLRTIAEDAKTYEQDTGAHVLFVGYPVLSLPPQARSGGSSAKRIVAPIAFIPVEITIKATRPQSVTLTAAGEGAELVVPNTALLAFIERSTGKRLQDLFSDEEGKEPWREIDELVTKVCEALDVPRPATPFSPDTTVDAVPRTEGDDAREGKVTPSAVLGLFPVNNQALLRDLEALASSDEPIEGPLESFLRAGVGLGGVDAKPTASLIKPEGHVTTERLVTWADPCQARAVRFARKSRGLVVHGPPGTGKSQTIVNVIGDHLARGERVLFVCDKRTALDVVQHRLTHLGLGHLSAIVHDAQRDQRELYKGIRDQLDALPESKTNPGAVADLTRTDAELAKIHDELTAHFHALTDRPNEGADASLHDLAGEWLTLDLPPELNVVPVIEGVALDELVPLEREVREALERATKEDFPRNPWAAATSLVLGDWLAKPLDTWRTTIAEVHDAARAADTTVGSMAPFDEADVAAQGAARADFAEKLGAVAETVCEIDEAALPKWVAEKPKTLAKAHAALEAVRPSLEVLDAAKPDPELGMVLRSKPLAGAEIVLLLGKLGAYLTIARAWYAFFCFGRKKQAREVLERFGLGLGAEPADRVTQLLEAARARRLVEECVTTTLALDAMPTQLGDEELVASVRRHQAIVSAMRWMHETKALTADVARVRAAVAASSHGPLLEAFAASRARAAAIVKLESAARASNVFSDAWLALQATSLRAGEPVLPTLTALEQRIGNVEGVLRIQRALSAMPEPIASAVVKLCERDANADEGWTAMKRGVLNAEIGRRIQASPVLLDVDDERLRVAHARFQALARDKQALVRDAVLDLWTRRARTRLLAATGSRLNAAGAELRRRLLLRGERAMRVRQVIAAGATTEGGDPLFDLRPVWMASPETVAQIFPRLPLFDVVIFDEASQCRLEEALPVLTRAKRVVIAGDPKQLPPTRFFESAVTRTEDADGDLTEQGLFEEQQADTEDLLAAALNLEIEQSYLDVHYRSQNSDLIEFSNQSFYDSRLQAIPGHPKNRTTLPPLALVHVNGVYDKRVNPIEAKEVARIVRELLSLESPPSIGIACFNLVQRDAIVTALDEAAATDPVFGSRLAVARRRQGSASFEGLFVKNLENVQGDERDHMIISTTYGPDLKGRFYRRFGPLALAGGGRRLNVLVTRARQKVHLVTSIPTDVYRNLPPVEVGRTPNGAWLLFSYLAYAETLAIVYAAEHVRRSQAELAKKGSTREYASRTPSLLARAIARRLGETHGMASDVFWGNDGFCVDVALHHPARPEEVTVGVLCDRSRYDKAEDAIEWDLFRTQILESQGWQFIRTWTPALVRDPEGVLEAIKKAADAKVAKDAATVHAAARIDGSGPASAGLS